MRILIYTITTNDFCSLECTHLLYKSLRKFFPLDFDFQAFMPQPTNASVLKSKDYICPIRHTEHIFKLKYSDKILCNNYSYFIYLDSDILWTLTDIPKDFTQFNYVYSEGNINKKPWSKYWPTEQYHLIKNQSKYNSGINAGFFAFQKHNMQSLICFMEDHLASIKIKRKNRFVEQNMFNLFVYKYFYLNILNKDKIISLDNNVANKSNESTHYYKNKIYHFDGDMCRMDYKLDRMNRFLSQNKICL